VREVRDVGVIGVVGGVGPTEARLGAGRECRDVFAGAGVGRVMEWASLEATQRPEDVDRDFLARLGLLGEIVEDDLVVGEDSGRCFAPICGVAGVGGFLGEAEGDEGFFRLVGLVIF
jgi:hypothetical protein